MIKKNICGIYKITNLITLEFYIGSTVNYNTRKYTHKYWLNRKLHFNPHLQNSWNKHGEENFVFELLEEMYFPEEYNTGLKRDYLECLEQFYIDTLHPKYNALRVASICNTGNYKHSEKTKEKMRISKKNIDHAALQNKRVLKLHKPVLLYCAITGNYLREFKSVKEAAIYIKLATTNVSYSIRYNKKMKQGTYFCIYKTEKIILPHIAPPQDGRSTELVKEAMSKRNSLSIIIFNNNQLLGEFKSIKDASKKLGISAKLLSKIRLGTYPYKISKYAKYKIELKNQKEK